MELVNVHQLKPGYVVAAPVSNPSGAILCPLGFKLTEGAIARLVTAGIESVAVEGRIHKEPPVEQRLKALNARFKGIEDPLLLQIKAAIEQYRRGLAV